MKKTLYLPLKAKWYDMIESGIKTEEYRKIMPYWIKRICEKSKGCIYGRDGMCELCMHTYGVHTNITDVCFSYGYTKRKMLFPVEKISIGEGNPQWGAPNDETVFIIKLKGDKR